MDFGITLILFAVFFAISLLLRPKPQSTDVRPDSLGQFKLPTATEGRTVPLIWGRVKIDGSNVTWYGNLKTQPITKKIKTGLFSSKEEVLAYKYFLGIQFALCRGVVDKLTRVWIDDKVVYDGGDVSHLGSALINKPELFGGEDQQGGVKGHLKFYGGTLNQNEDSYLDSKLNHSSITDTPGYRGTCYVVWTFGSADPRGPGYIGNSSNVRPFAFEVERIPNGLGMTMGHDKVQTFNANPANVLYEILTDPDWGLGFSDSDIDLTAFITAGETLYDEDNGWSMILDNPMSAQELIKEVERQIDGVLYMDRTSGKWTIKLVRADYTLSMQPAIDETNIIEIKDFTRASWHNTSNNVQIPFTDRDKNYKATYARAQDVANMALQGGNVVTIEDKYPGVMSRTTANRLAWRALRLNAYPLAKAQFVVDRTLYALNVGDVVRWSDTKLGITDMAMRITRIDLGSLEDGAITIDCVQDVFAHETASFADPDDSDWVDPAGTPVDIPSADRLIFEAPKAFTDRVEPGKLGNGGGLGGGGVFNRIWCGARDQEDGTNGFEIWSSIESATYRLDGKVKGYLLSGELDADLTIDNVEGSDTITVKCTPDTQSDLLDRIQPRTPTEIGQHLKNIVLVGNEFIGFQDVAANGSDKIDLTGCYRALMDTVPQNHAADDRVWFISLVGDMTQQHFIFNDDIDIKLLPFGPFGQLALADATNTTITINRRGKLPYPPSIMNLDGDNWQDPVNINSGVDLVWIRRDFRTVNEVEAVVDEASLTTDFPSFNTTEYQVKVYVDPDGANTLTYTSAWIPDGDLHLDASAFSGGTTYTFDNADDGELPMGFTTYYSPSGDLTVPYTGGTGLMYEAMATADLRPTTPPTSGQEVVAAQIDGITSPPSTRSYTIRLRYNDPDQWSAEIYDRADFSIGTGVIATITIDPTGPDTIVFVSLLGQTIGVSDPSTGFVSYGDNGAGYTITGNTLPMEIDFTISVSGNDYELFVNGVSQFSPVTITDLTSNTGVGFGFGFTQTSGTQANPGIIRFVDGGGTATRARITIDTRHVFGVTTVLGLQALTWDFDVIDV